jgi:hypothetical protein
LLNDETFRLPGSFGRLEKIVTPYGFGFSLFCKNGFGSVRLAETNLRSSSAMTPVQSAKGPFPGCDAGPPVNNRRNAGRVQEVPVKCGLAKNKQGREQGDHSNNRGIVGGTA